MTTELPWVSLGSGGGRYVRLWPPGLFLIFHPLASVAPRTQPASCFAASLRSLYDRREKYTGLSMHTLAFTPVTANYQPDPRRKVLQMVSLFLLLGNVKGKMYTHTTHHNTRTHTFTSEICFGIKLDFKMPFRKLQYLDKCTTLLAIQFIYSNLQKKIIE